MSDGSIKIIKLSPYHKVFYHDWKLHANTNKYNLVSDQVLSSNLEVTRLRDALAKLISNYVLLNSHVNEEDGELYWVTNTSVFKLEYFEANTDSKMAFQYVSKPFDLECGPLYRFAVFCQEDNTYRFIIVLHHIIIDGISGKSFISEVSRFYNDSTYKAKYSLEQQIINITTTTNKIYENLNLNFEKCQKFWRNILFNVEPIDLRFLKSNQEHIIDGSINHIKELRFSFFNDVNLKLKVIQNKYGLSAYFYGQLIFALLFFKYNIRDKFVISYPVAIKVHLNLIYGAGINTIFSPYTIRDNDTILEIIQYTKQINNAINGEVYTTFPISQIIEHNKDILDVFFAQTNLKDNKLSFTNVEVLNINDYLNIDLGCKLMFEQEVRGDLINYRVKYNELEIDHIILQKFVDNYKKLFLDVLFDLANGVDNNLIKQYTLLNERIYKDIYFGVNKIYDSNKTIHQMFEDQVTRVPNNIAIAYKNINLTYSELNVKANQLSHLLLSSYSIKSDDLICLCLDKSEYTIITILAILKSGAGYVPIDPNYPLERISYILHDSKSKIILINSSNEHKLNSLMLSNDTVIKQKMLIVDSTEVAALLLQQSQINPVTSVNSQNLSYVIYTSGTTGKPKGVIQQHNNIIRLFAATDSWFNFNDKDIWVLFHSYVFDFSIWELCGALFYGGKLIIPSYEQNRDLEQFYILCQQENITVLNQTPSVFYQFSGIVISNFKVKQLNSLRYIIFGGEALNFKQLKTWFEYYDGNKTQLINMYGITETSVHVTYKRINVDELNEGTIIGAVIPDQKIYVLDDCLNLLPIGAIGELYVGGAGLARGYLNQLELTKKRFIENPFQLAIEKASNINSRLYKTGDLVRMLVNGELEYIGRNDDQVKVRGYRIELGEIENKLLNYPGVKQVVVLNSFYRTSKLASDQIMENVNSQENKCLIGYYVADEKINEAEILNYLATQLPEYMLPSALVYIQAMPLTINGKLDKRYLSNLPVILDNYVAPQSMLEQKICEAFAVVLKLPLSDIGINHDFFNLGGNSLLAVHLVIQLRNDSKITVNDIFQFRTPSRLAKVIFLSKDNVQNNIKQIKSMYEKLDNYNKEDQLIANHKQLEYFEQIKNTVIDLKLKIIKNVLLTGSTGYLGCHILHQLLTGTGYKIYLLVRGESYEQVYQRIVSIYKYYFDMDMSIYVDRVIILVSDIEKDNLNLGHVEYQELVHNIDSIIHAAALVKHYGDVDVFYSANVKATLNLLDLSKQTEYKDFHYISTASVFDEGYIHNCSYYIFTEDDTNIIMEGQENLYIKTKVESENYVRQYRQYGINTSIYRVGNLVLHSKSQKLQKNIGENAFFIKLKTILNLGIIPSELSKVEISPVDITALAIVKLFNQANLSNQTYHLFNPNVVDLFQIFSLCYGVNISISSIDDFINKILTKVDNSSIEEVELFILHQGWLQNINLQKLTKVSVLQDRTGCILSLFDIKWPIITPDMLLGLIKHVFFLQRVGMLQNPLFKYLDYIAEKIPSNLYWVDKNGIVVGLNQKTLNSIGATHKKDIIGKNVYEIYPKPIADGLSEHLAEVLSKGVEVQKEHVIKDLSTGNSRYYSDMASPLFDESGVLIGVIGTSVEITDSKEKALLEIENEKNKTIIQEQHKFRKDVDQVVHDIRSPLTSLEMLAKHCLTLPEQERNSFREIATTIADIANNLLNKYDSKHHKNSVSNENDDGRQSILISMLLSQLLSDKKYQYKQSAIKFETHFSQDSYFACINAQPTSLKRSISNIINNSVDAIEGNEGKVTIRLDATSEFVKITITDNGKGMPPEIISKIMDDETVTTGKNQGHGIGMTQVREMLQRNNGKLVINSIIDGGSSVSLTFARVTAPSWIVTELVFNSDDILVVLDDDESIHLAWDARLEAIRNDNPSIQIHHFKFGEDVLDFVNKLSQLDRSKVFLLSDYELLQQKLNGLEIIRKSEIKRTIIVTSHFNDVNVCKEALSINTKILPKQLATEVLIKIGKAVTLGIHSKEGESVKQHYLKPVDLVLVDDDKLLINSFVRFMFAGMSVDTYFDPNELLDNMSKYSTDTKIALDNNYKGFELKGTDVAKMLHKRGYTKLYILSGDNIDKLDCSEYAIAILKTDLDSVKKYLVKPIT